MNLCPLHQIVSLCVYILGLPLANKRVPGERKKGYKCGHCLVVWTEVCLPKNLGSLGISSKYGLGCQDEVAMVAKTDPSYPWAAFQFQSHKSVHAVFSIALITEVGNRAGTLFWLINGCKARGLLIWRHRYLLWLIRGELERGDRS